ncbi:MAG: TetR/AcrR family transcriptional regulator [Eubacteriales bacterium]|nr:TetR/AcrR family transcriptional regulator [Eubacteriales bacterium]
MDNRNKILERALNLFYQKGYDAVGIQEICQSAGVTKPTLYHYFGSKYGLLETLLKEEYEIFIQKLTKAAQYSQSIEHSLTTFATALIDFANTNHEAYMLLMAMSYSAKENEVYQAVKPYITNIYNMAVNLFEQASDQLGNMNGRQEQFAIGFLGLVNHYILFMGYRSVPGEETMVSEEKKYSLIHQFMHGIYS